MIYASFECIKVKMLQSIKEGAGVMKNAIFSFPIDDYKNVFAWYNSKEIVG